MFCKDPHDCNIENGFQGCQREKEHAISDNCHSSGEECQRTLDEGGRSKDGRSGQINELLGFSICGSCLLIDVAQT